MIVGRRHASTGSTGRDERIDSVRAFVAFELESGLRAARLPALIANLLPLFPGLRWARPEGVHLTLRFLGAASPAQIDRLKQALGQAASRSPSTVARIAGLGFFPERGSPRVLWLGVAVAPSVLDLQAACEKAAVDAGFAAESRPFRAHLTLGRWRDRVRRPQLPAVDLGPVPLDTLALFRSQLGGGGSIYTAIERWSLRQAPRD